MVAWEWAKTELCFIREQTGFDNTVCVLGVEVEGTEWLQVMFM